MIYRLNKDNKYDKFIENITSSYVENDCIIITTLDNNISYICIIKDNEVIKYEIGIHIIVKRIIKENNFYKLLVLKQNKYNYIYTVCLNDKEIENSNYIMESIKVEEKTLHNKEYLHVNKKHKNNNIVFNFNGIFLFDSIKESILKTLSNIGIEYKENKK